MNNVLRMKAIFVSMKEQLLDSDYQFISFRLAGNNVVLRVYLIEFLPTKQRGCCLVILDTLGIIGSVSTLGKRSNK